jgi:hypothetical protein
MNTKAKVLVPNQVWIVEDHGTKLGTLNKEKKGYAFFRNGVKTKLHDLSEVKAQFGSDLFRENVESIKSVKANDSKYIYDYPCSSKPYNPVYNIKKRLPIYAKSSKSKSLYCAGYYVIQFKKGWVKSFCPKLITLERYPFQGPFKSDAEMKTVLNQVNKL